MCSSLCDPGALLQDWGTGGGEWASSEPSTLLYLWSPVVLGPQTPAPGSVPSLPLAGCHLTSYSCGSSFDLCLCFCFLVFFLLWSCYEHFYHRVYYFIITMDPEIYVFVQEERHIYTSSVHRAAGCSS